MFNQKSKEVTTMGRLADKNILITGGNSGIGLAAAQEFDREGARVAICGLNEKTLQAAKGTLGAGSLAIRAESANSPTSIRCSPRSSGISGTWMVSSQTQVTASSCRSKT